MAGIIMRTVLLDDNAFRVAAIGDASEVLEPLKSIKSGAVSSMIVANRPDTRE